MTRTCLSFHYALKMSLGKPASGVWGQALDSNHDLPWYDGADNFCPPLTERGDNSL